LIILQWHNINITNDNQVENEMCNGFVEKHKELCKKLKVLLDSNLINYLKNMNHINFDSSLTLEEKIFPKRNLKLKFIIKILISKLKVQIDNKLIDTMNFKLKRNKLKLYL